MESQLDQIMEVLESAITPDELRTTLELERQYYYPSDSIILIAGLFDVYDAHSCIVDAIDDRAPTTAAGSKANCALFSYRSINLTMGGGSPVENNKQSESVDTYLLRGPASWINSFLAGETRSLDELLPAPGSDAKMVFVFILDCAHPEYIYNELKGLLELAGSCKESRKVNSGNVSVGPNNFVSIAACLCNSGTCLLMKCNPKNSKRVDILQIALRILCVEHSAILLHASLELPESLRILKFHILSAINPAKFPSPSASVPEDCPYNNNVYASDNLENIQRAVERMDDPLKEAVSKYPDKSLLEDLLHDEGFLGRADFPSSDPIPNSPKSTEDSSIAEISSIKSNYEARVTRGSVKRARRPSGDACQYLHTAEVGDCVPPHGYPKPQEGIATANVIAKKPTYKSSHSNEAVANFFQSLLASKKKDSR